MALAFLDSGLSLGQQMEKIAKTQTMYQTITLFLLSCLLFPQWGIGQDEDLRNYDHVYLENIRSALLHRSDSVLSYPIIPLNRGRKLRLTFDDMDADVKDYVYTIVHCGADWQPSELDVSEYIDGFEENNLLEYQFSYNTIREYTHFELDLPNEDIRWTKSGNYLLKVYEDEDEKRLAITKRFMITENLMNVSGRFVRPSDPEISSTHQRLSFTIIHPDIRIGNPQDEITTVLLQNGRWDNAILNLKPKFVRNEQLVYDYLDKTLFPGGKEFRDLDMRSFEFRTGRTEEIEEYDDHYKVYLKPDQPRPYRPYVFYRDINGRYVVENLDVSLNFGRTARIDIAESFSGTDSQAAEHARQGDYAYAHFRLEAAIPYEGRRVYIIGAFSDWQCLPEYELTYEPSANEYRGQAFLKQGFYNYAYVLVPEEDPTKINFTDIEGSWHETENEYQVLVYWRPFGQRYDRLAALRTFNSVIGQ